jgi:hypothetical protein
MRTFGRFHIVRKNVPEIPCMTESTLHGYLTSRNRYRSFGCPPEKTQNDRRLRSIYVYKNRMDESVSRLSTLLLPVMK